MKKIISAFCLALFLGACAIGCSGSSTSAPPVVTPVNKDKSDMKDKMKPGS